MCYAFRKRSFNDKTDEVIEKPFQWLLSRYQIPLGTPMKGSDCVICVRLLYYKCHKINPNCRGIIYRFSWLDKKQKAAINPINRNGNQCFQYAIKVALNHEEIRKHSQRISKIKYNWKGINYPSEKDNL